MDTWKLLFVLLIVSLLKMETCVAGPIRMGYFLLPPYQYLNKQEDATQPRGSTIKYFGVAAALMEEQVEWVGPLPLLRLVAYLKTGQLDGTVAFYRSPEFEPFLHYAASPVLLAQPILLVRQDNPITGIQSIEDIRGYRIGHVVTAGGRYTPMLDKHRDAITLDGLGGNRWAELNIRKLLAGRLDAVFDRQPYTLQFVAARMHQSAQVNVLPLPDPPTPVYVVFSKTSQRGQVLLDKYNAILPKLKVDYIALTQEELDGAIAKEKVLPETTGCSHP